MELEVYFRQVMDGDTFVCGNCRITFTSMEDYARHKYKVHHLRFTLTKSFSQKPNVFFPALVKKSGSALASGCIDGKEMGSAKRKERMTFNKQLIEEADTLTTGSRCSMCQRSFRNQKSLSLHQRNAHQTCIYRCDLCPKAFMGQESYDKHVTIHMWKFACNICEKRYQSKAGLKNHLRKHKKLEDNANTLNTDKWVLSENIKHDSNNMDIPISELTSDQGNHHDNQKEETEPQKLQDPPPNPLQPNYVIKCNVCNKFYKTPSDLLQHLIMLHITLTPHKCGLCDFSCTKRDILALHMLNEHSKELNPNTKLDSLQVDNKGNLVIEASMLMQQSSKEEMDKIQSLQDISEEEQLPRVESTVEKIPQQTCKEHIRNKDQGERVDDGADNIGTRESTCDQTRTMETSNTQMTPSKETTSDKTNTIGNQDVSHSSEAKRLNIGERLTQCATRDVDASVNTLEDSRGLCDKSNLVVLNQHKEDELVQAVQQLTAVHACIVDVLSNPRQDHSELSPGQVSNLPTTKDQITCVVCQRVYKRPADLKVHMRRHTGERPYWCDICQKGFITRDSLQKHSVVHSEERRYKCGECGKLFKRMGHVRTHLLHTHSTEKTQMCCICHKHFKTKTALDVHLKRHMPTKPYCCPFCRKSFKDKGTMVRHIRTHTGDRPHVCDKCGRRFSEGSALRRHQKAKVPCTMRKSSNPGASLTQDQTDSHKSNSSQDVGGIDGGGGVAEEVSTDYHAGVDGLDT